jgi:hypothetical protein
MLLELGSRVAREMLFFELVVNAASFLSASSEQPTGCTASILVLSADRALS